MSELSFSSVAGCPHRPHLIYLKKWLPRAVRLVRNAPAEISIALIGDIRMAKLHADFMNIAGTTDVLTFELDHDAKGRVTAGEVVICVPYARREAKRRKITADSEVLLYALHGVLHLSGYDDLTPNDHAKMHKEEDRILKRIGIGAVFKSTT